MYLSLASDVIAQCVLMGHELDRAEPQFRAFIDRLPIDEQAELVALMWVGRGAFDAQEWQTALETALSEATTPCADYLIGTPHFADHIEAGADALGVELAEDENFPI